VAIADYADGLNIRCVQFAFFLHLLGPFGPQKLLTVINDGAGFTWGQRLIGSGYLKSGLVTASQAFK